MRFFKWIFFLHFFLVATVYAGMPTGASSITSLEISSDSSDLDFFGSIIQNAKIVALGESVHTDGSYHKINVRLARFLVEKQGFRNVLLETPWSQARMVNTYVNDCTGMASVLSGMQSIFPQFSSVELAALFQWLQEFNCSHPQDKVKFFGFDIQQYSSAGGLPSFNPFDEGNLESFVQASVPSLVSRLSDLRLCGPGQSNNWQNGPATEAQLKMCQKFLTDLEPFIQKQKEAFELENSLIALKFFSAMAATRSQDPVASSGWRDLGMAKMIQYFLSQKADSAKVVVIAHEGHVSRNFQEVSNFATKSMGTFLDEYYGEKYFVSIALSLKPSGSSWWTPISPISFPGNDSVENLFQSLGIGSFILDLKENSLIQPLTPVNLSGVPNVVMSKHFDAVVFIPATLPMTNFPGVIYPSVSELAIFDPGFEACRAAGSVSTGWILTEAQGISIGCDSIQRRSGQWSISLSSSVSHPDAGGIVQCRPTNGYVGKVQVAGYLKAENVANGVASIGIIVLNSQGVVDKTDFQKNGISGTTDWMPFSSSLMVSKDVGHICWGITMTGSGKAWADDLHLN